MHPNRVVKLISTAFFLVFVKSVLVFGPRPWLGLAPSSTVRAMFRRLGSRMIGKLRIQRHLHVIEAEIKKPDRQS